MVCQVVCDRACIVTPSERPVDSRAINMVESASRAEPLLDDGCLVVDVRVSHTARDLLVPPSETIVGEAGQFSRSLCDPQEAVRGVPFVSLRAITRKVPVGVVGIIGRRSRLTDLVRIRP